MQDSNLTSTITNIGYLIVIQTLQFVDFFYYIAYKSLKSHGTSIDRTGPSIVHLASPSHIHTNTINPIQHRCNRYSPQVSQVSTHWRHSLPLPNASVVLMRQHTWGRSLLARIALSPLKIKLPVKCTTKIWLRR